jgi:hypothetical protein
VALAINRTTGCESGGREVELSVAEQPVRATFETKMVTG